MKFWFGRYKIWYGKIIYTKKFTRDRTLFLGTRAIFIRSVPKIFCSVNGALVETWLSVGRLSTEGALIVHMMTRFILVLTRKVYDMIICFLGRHVLSLI